MGRKKKRFRGTYAVGRAICWEVDSQDIGCPDFVLSGLFPNPNTTTNVHMVYLNMLILASYGKSSRKFSASVIRH